LMGVPFCADVTLPATAAAASAAKSSRFLCMVVCLP
jgi:hypothetical protein